MQGALLERPLFHLLQAEGMATKYEHWLEMGQCCFFPSRAETHLPSNMHFYNKSIMTKQFCK